jgi:hypothetical protein
LGGFFDEEPPFLPIASLSGAREALPDGGIHCWEKINPKRAIRLYADGDILLFRGGICSAEPGCIHLGLPPGARRSR